MNLEKKNKNSIAIIGNQTITKFLIDYLKNKGLKISYIITLKNKKKYNITDTFNFKKEKIKLIEVKSYNLKNNLDILKIKKLKLDFLLVFGWSRLVPEWLIKHVKLATIGVHAGIYSPPRSRGRAVFNWALIGGYKKMLCYAMMLKPGVDNGDIFIKRNISITQHDDIESLYLKNSLISSEFFYKIISNWGYYKKNLTKQSNNLASYFPKREPSDGFINWNNNVDEIFNLIKALKIPYPNAYTEYKSTKILINEAMPFEYYKKSRKKNGEIVTVFPDQKFLVRCKDSFLLVKSFKTSKDFTPKVGMKFISSSIKKFDFSKI
jgi:methionyl-tRNA formyltransferase